MAKVGTRSFSRPAFVTREKMTERVHQLLHLSIVSLYFAICLTFIIIASKYTYQG
jgi:hypothetical protein